MVAWLVASTIRIWLATAQTAKPHAGDVWLETARQQEYTRAMPTSEIQQVAVI
jgi:hypothetical protein